MTSFSVRIKSEVFSMLCKVLHNLDYSYISQLISNISSFNPFYPHFLPLSSSDATSTVLLQGLDIFCFLSLEQFFSSYTHICCLVSLKSHKFSYQRELSLLSHQKYQFLYSLIQSVLMFCS